MTVFEEYQRRLAEWSDIQDHLQFLYETALGYGPFEAIELGVNTGQSTSAFLAAAELNCGHLWSCDTRSPRTPAEWYDSRHWSFIPGSSLDPGVLGVMPTDVDIVFIDSSHEFEATLAELHAYVPRVRPGGLVLLHDTQWLPPSTSLPEPGGPVTEAIHAFCVSTGRTWENRHSKPGWYGLGVIKI